MLVVLLLPRSVGASFVLTDFSGDYPPAISVYLADAYGNVVTGPLVTGEKYYVVGSTSMVAYDGGGEGPYYGQPYLGLKIFVPQVTAINEYDYEINSSGPPNGNPFQYYTSNGSPFIQYENDFTAPATPGSYNVTVVAENHWQCVTTYPGCDPSGYDQVEGTITGSLNFGVIAPTVTLTATPNPVGYNHVTTLTWTSTNATYCWSNDFLVPWGSSQNTTTDDVPDVVVNSFISSKKYTIHCGPNDNQDSAVAQYEVTSSVMVNVGSPAVIQGALESANCDYIKGWACQLDQNDNWGNYINTSFYDGTKLLTLYGAQGNIDPHNGNPFQVAVPRQDLVDANLCGGTGSHGFMVHTPDSLKDGQVHTLNVYGQDLYTRDWVPLSGSPMAKIICVLP